MNELLAPLATVFGAADAPHGTDLLGIGAMLAQFLIAALLALYFTPILRAAALAHDIVDRPDGRLKKHATPVAYLGGLAIFLAFLITLGLTVASFEGPIQGLLLGASIVLLLGLVDDMKALSPAVKFLGQLLAAWILLKSGIRVEMAVLVERHPLLADLVTVLWVVGITNAFNIIDVSDGLAAGVGAIAAVFLSIAAVLSGDPAFAGLAICIAGATFGFLRFNFHPASIYLGDAGSMLIGFLVGALTMLVSYTEHNALAVFVPLLILGVPLFDTVLVMILRARRGIPVFRGSPDHFAVRLRKAGVSARNIALGAYVASTVLGVAALVILRMERTASIVLLCAVLAVAIAVGVWVASIGNPTAAQVTPGAEDSAKGPRSP